MITTVRKECDLISREILCTTPLCCDYVSASNVGQIHTAGARSFLLPQSETLFASHAFIPTLFKGQHSLQDQP